MRRGTGEGRSRVKGRFEEDRGRAEIRAEVGSRSGVEVRGRIEVRIKSSGLWNF